MGGTRCFSGPGTAAVSVILPSSCPELRAYQLLL
ncbi:Protein of unknown function [Pyronema omphalodes CBS 100304]|uniref:Uncharacterized protein n=1 Tax=Pyronema omphalodes (strain CBS 100304) TaxID=1076935 RepID=U4L8A7_PYROM|nr:Protein of unknown function [Pyronema omphalodes CBS 100304]